MLDLTKLNHNQYEAVTCMDKYIRVVAGAGSGKTRVLTNRISYLISEGVSPRNILAITFTNKASNEMKERVLLSLENKVSAPLIATFHSFCLRLLKEDIKVLGYPLDFNIIDEEDKTKLVKQILKDLNVDKNYINHNDIINYISFIKTNFYNTNYVNKSFRYDIEREKDKAKIFKVYEERMNRMFCLDFDDLLVKAYLILTNYQDIKEKWQKRFKYVLVDEFQDTNDIQFDLIKLIVGKDNNLFVVGDPDQTIYTWRGANLKIIMEFETLYKGAKTIILDENYRSKQRILDLSNTLIKNNKKRISKDLLTCNGLGEEITYYHLDSSLTEANKVVELIKCDMSKYNYAYKDIAILYRANYQSREIENALVRNNIPYKIYGGIKFYERKEIKDSLAYLRLIVNSDDDLALTRIINEPKRGLGDTTLDKFRDIANNYNISLYKAIRENIDVISRVEVRNNINRFIDMIEGFKKREYNIDLVNVLDDILKDSGYYNMLVNDEEEERKDNIKELMNNMTYYENNSDSVSLVGFLQEISLFTTQDEMDEKDHVSLMTVHTAKGLEYKVVFVIGLCEGIFPSAKSLMEDLDNIEEERRLAYVAFTRAKEILHLSSNYGINFVLKETGTPSRFIREIKGYYKDCNNYVSRYESLDNQKTYYNNYIKSSNYLEVKNRPKEIVNTKAVITNTTNNISWSVGDKLTHITYGLGVVLNVKGDFLEIAFQDNKVGIKVMLAKHGSLSKC